MLIINDVTEQGPVVQSIVSLTSSLAVKMLTVLITTVELEFTGTFAEKMWVAFAHFFSKNIRIYAIFNDWSFKDMLTNNIISFE